MSALPVKLLATMSLETKGDQQYVGDSSLHYAPCEILNAARRKLLRQAPMCESQITGYQAIHSLAPFVRQQTQHAFSNLIEQYKPLAQKDQRKASGPRHVGLLAAMLAVTLLSKDQYREFARIVPIPSKHPLQSSASDLTCIMQVFSGLQNALPELKRWSIEWSLLRFVRPVPSLRLTELAQREAAVSNALMCTAAQLPREIPILVIDDIVTTGATLKEAARALRSTGATRISGLTLGKRIC